MTESGLARLDRCFRGMVPATLSTCSPRGVPNVTFLSAVRPVDENHVALSFQFFNKSKRNVEENPHAQVLMMDPVTLQQFRLHLRYEETATEGAVFDGMKTHLDAIASQTGMEAVFRLRGADLYEVLEVEELACDLDLEPEPLEVDHLSALEVLSRRIEAAEDLEALVTATLEGLDETLGYEASFFMVTGAPTESEEGRLYAIGSHGYPTSGAGAEVVIGEGLIGSAAAQRRIVREDDMVREMTMAQAVRDAAVEAGAEGDLGEEIPLPGLPNLRSQLAVPLAMRENLLGVLVLQSEEVARFRESDEQPLLTLARYVATAMTLLASTHAEDAATTRSYGEPRPSGGSAVHVEYHHSDGSVFLDHEYLIKGLAGRILRRLLDIYERDGRTEFTNKEVRVDPELELPAYRDNLEARLILLRRRLEDRNAFVRVAKISRGRFRLEVKRPFRLDIRD